MQVHAYPQLLDRHAAAEGGIPFLYPADLNTILGTGELILDHSLALSVPAVPCLGHMTMAELALLVGVVRSARAQSVFEIGTFDGLTIHNLLLNCPLLNHILTVDLPDSIHRDAGRGATFPLDKPNAEMLGTERIGHRYALTPRREIVEERRIDSALLRANQFDLRYDVVIVDGAHSYRYCRHDGELAAAVIARPGLILFHNFGKIGENSLAGVTHYLLELAAQGTPHLYRLHNGDSPTSLVMRICLPGTAF